MKLLTVFFAFGLVHLPNVIAWGELGHNTTGYIASSFVSQTTARHLKEILRDSSDGYLAEISGWADWFKRHGGQFSRNLHFIDAHDDPGNHDCNVNYQRDCKEGGCVISALANYTDRAMDGSLGEKEKQIATKMLVHLLGDLTQPLHNEDVEKGGNDIDVKWGRGKKTLHSVWDTEIPEKYTKDLEGGADKALNWANKIVNEITDGKFTAEKQKWLEGFDFGNPNGTAMVWSQEANQLVCSHVFPRGYAPNQIENKQLDGEYYEKAAPVVERQIARAGFRMAAWLDAVADEIARKKSRGQQAGEL